MKKLLLALLLLASPAQAQNTFFAGTPGDMIYRGTSAWARVPGGTTAGQLLMWNGAGTPPIWTTDLSGVSTLLLPRIAANRVLGNVTGSNASPTAITVNQWLDTIGYDTARPPQPGSIIYKDGTTGTWQALPVPTPVGWVLTTTGPQSQPQWAASAAAAVPGAAGGCLESNGVGVAPTYQSCLNSTNFAATSPLVAAFGAIQTMISCPTCTVGTASALTKTDDTNVTLTLGGTPATALLQAVSLTLGWTGTLALSRLAQGTDGQLIVGQTSAASLYKTITGDWTLSAAGAATLATVNSNVGSFGSATQCTAITVNAKGLITAASASTCTPAASSITGGQALTKTDDTNVTLTLGGTPSTSLLAATSITVGWTSTLSVARGGTGLGSGTSGGIPYFSGTTTIASSALLTANAIMFGGGAGTAPATGLGLGTTTTVLHGNAAGLPSWAAVVSADLNITTTTCTNQFLTAISTTATGTCTTDTLASAQHANQGTTTTLLHGNGAGNPSWGAASLTADVSGTLPVANGGTNNTTFTAYALLAAGTNSTGAFQNVSGVGSSGQVLTSNGAAALPTWQTVSGTGSVTSVVIAPGAGMGTFTGTCTITTSGTCTIVGSGAQLPGVATNTLATAGNVGELLTSVCAGTSQTATVTITIASPAVITWTAHPWSATAPRSDVCPVVFTTSIALPTGITAGTTYWTIPSTITANTFQIATSVANAITGTAVNTSGSQSGTQTGTAGVAMGATGTTKSVTALPLTAGDWDVWGTVSCTYSVSSSLTVGGIGTTIDVMPSPDTGNQAREGADAVNNTGVAIPIQPVLLSGTTNYFLTAGINFAAGQGGPCWGVQRARRVR